MMFRSDAHCLMRALAVMPVGFLLASLPACRPVPSAAGAPTAIPMRASAAPEPQKPQSTERRGDAPAITADALSPLQIPNFHVVHPSLLRGAAPTPEGLRRLKELGVKTVIDLRISPKQVAAERKEVEALGMRFINLPMSGDPPTAREVKTFLAEATDPARPLLFVHCQHGADRTGTMVGIYREQVDGWSFDRAYREMRRYGFSPHWRRLTATVRQYAPTKARPAK